MYGEEVDTNVLWAYFDGPGEGWMTFNHLKGLTQEKEHFESIPLLPEITDAFSACTILESVLHINYSANTEFIELEKLFRMFPLSENVPIVRYRTGSNIEPFFKIHKSLTVEFSKNELKELLAGSSASTKEKRYIGFKVRLNQRFNTVNLYADGKMDVYCAWEEKVAGVGATKDELLAVVQTVIDLVEEINILNYHKIGTDSTARIIPPNTNLTGNTLVSNYNTLNLINLSEDDYSSFPVLEKKIREFSSYVSVLTTDVPDKLVLRYKKITNYMTSENIKKFIRTSAKSPALLTELQTVFDLSLGGAQYYLDKFSDEAGEKAQKPSYPGTLIEISRQHNSTSLRCKFMGANNDTIGAIYAFVQKMFTYSIKGKKRPRIQAKKKQEAAVGAASSNDNRTITDMAGNERVIFDKTGKVNMTKPKPSLLDYLKIMGLPYIPDKKKDSPLPNYARETCQCHKHPVVIYKEDHYLKLKAELDAMKDNTEETNLNRLSFKQGQRDKNGFFYFCPVTWDYQNIKNMDVGRAPYFPKFSEVTKESDYFRRKPEELKSLYARNDGNGFCCYVNPYKDAETEENKVKTQSYILKANVELSPGRFGYLTDNLNHMFNPDQKNKSLYLWMHPGHITDTIDDRSFLACMARINEKTIDATLEELARFLQQDSRHFQSLKMGSLYTLFTPQDEYSNQQSIQEALGFERIVEEFLLYVVHHREKINEDFLWDYFTEKLDANIFIYEFETETMLCPKGYALDKMYKESRPSVVLNKNGNQYTILSYATFNNAAPPTANTKHNTDNRPIFALYETVQQNCQVKTNRLTLAQLKAKTQADPGLLDIIYPQIIDSYNKVRFVRVRMGSNGSVFWFPLEASGLDMEQGVIPLSGLLKNLSSVFETIEMFEALALYYGFDGYLVKHVLLRYGLNIEHAQEDTVIGVRLENNLVVYTEPLPVEVFQSVRYFQVMNPDTKQEKRIMNTFMTVREDIWFSDEFEYEQGQGLEQKDMRQIYVTRLHFEQDAYNRFRTLISGLLVERPDVGQKIKTAVEPGSIEELPVRRTEIYEILKQLTKTSVTHESTPTLLNAIGPIDCGYKDISAEDMERYAFSDYRPSSDEMLFIPDVNLITGDKNNMDYYLFRVVEELQRSPFKRDEILNNLLVEDTADYYLENTDKAIDKLYETRVSLEEKMSTHFDILNLKTEPDTEEGNYLINLKRLPVYWREKLYNAEGVFLQLEVPDLYTELDHILQTSVRARLYQYIRALSEEDYELLAVKYGSPDEDQWHLKMNLTDLRLIAELYGISFLLLKDTSIARIGEAEQYIILFQDSLVLSDRKQKIFPVGDLPLYLTGIPPMTGDMESSVEMESERKRKTPPTKKKLPLKLKKAKTQEEVAGPAGLAFEPAVEPAVEPMKRIVFKRKVKQEPVGEPVVIEPVTTIFQKRVFRPKKKL